MCVPPCQLFLTERALDKQRRLGITHEEIHETLDNPDRYQLQQDGPHIRPLMHHYRSYATKTIRLTYNVDTGHIVTLGIVGSSR